MPRDIKAEDLIITDEDGTRHIDHDMLESYGLFNLPKMVLRSALMVYYDNARRQDQHAVENMRVFIDITNSLSRFPKQVVNNFTRGAAYRRNMKMLKKYSK